jgi:hypothetical protein
MRSHSQAGQDIFVRLILGENTPRFFLDIGCAGDLYSNTLALEQEGWKGILVDVDDTAKGRKNQFIRADAKTVNLNLCPKYVDYLSLDIDEGTLDALENVMLHHIRFGIITIEHDAYRFGNKLRSGEREILKRAGYELICEDVCGTEDAPFEDWWVSKELSTKAEKFRGHFNLWSDILNPKINPEWLMATGRFVE